jgi:hypothetical protein
MENISGFCPYCHKNVTFSWVRTNERGGDLATFLSEYFSNKNGMWIIGECPSCKNCVLIQAYKDNRNGELVASNISPTPIPSPADERIPEKIRGALNEAKICFSVNAFMACATMCRRTIQCACIDQGAEKDKLYDQIDELFSKGIITKQIKDWAHSIRLVGNDAAHPTNLEVSKEDSKDILDLAEQLMNILYVMPSIASKHQEIHKKES